MCDHVLLKFGDKGEKKVYIILFLLKKIWFFLSTLTSKINRSLSKRKINAVGGKKKKEKKRNEIMPMVE